MPEIHYICDKRACGFCPNDLCNHTSDIRHAKNFELLGDLYFEKESTMAEIENMPNTDDLVMRVETKEIEMTEEQQEKATEDIQKRYKPLTEEQKANRRFWNFLDMVYKLAQMSGLYIEGHIKVRDKRTGKVWE